MRDQPDPCPPRSFDEPASRPQVRRPLPVIPRHVALSVRLDPNGPDVVGEVAHTVTARVEPVTRLSLDAADLDVTEASAPGRRVHLHPWVGGVELLLDPPLTPGETSTLTLAFTARPTLGLHRIEADPVRGKRAQIWTQGAMESHHHWFPCFDAPHHLVTTEVRATVPTGFLAVSNGAPVPPDDAAAPEPGWTTFHYRHDTPHALYLLTLVVDRLVPVPDDRAAVPIIHYVPADRVADAQVIFERVPEMLAYFGEALDLPYPYPRYGHVFLQDFMWGGMENTTLTSLTDTLLLPGKHCEEEDIERLIAHELAHQWFGNLVAPAAWSEIWLNESFATYFEILCMGALEGDNDFARRLVAERDSYLEESTTRYARAIVEPEFADPYVLFDRHAYEKGALVLHTLRDQIGDAAFFAGVRRYLADQRGSAAETPDLRRAFEWASGRDLRPFFAQWIYGAGHPKVTVRWTYRPNSGLSVALQRTDETGQEAEITLAVHTVTDGAHHTRRHRVLLPPGGGHFVFAQSTPPLWVALDPDQACLVEIDERGESDLALQARLDVDHASTLLRIRTARLLGERATAANTAALARVLADDPAHAVRIEAAKALGEHRSASARRALEATVAGRAHWRIRAAAAQAWGQGGHTEHAERVIALLSREQRHRVKCGLLAALGQMKCASARRAIEAHLDHPSPRDSVAAAATKALAAQEDAAVIPELQTRATPDHPLAVRQEALEGLARLSKLDPIEPNLARTCRETIEAHLTDPTFQVRRAAAKAAGNIGAPQLILALRRAHEAEPHGILRRLYREAMGACGAP